MGVVKKLCMDFKILFTPNKLIFSFSQAMWSPLVRVTRSGCLILEGGEVPSVLLCWAPLLSLQAHGARLPGGWSQGEGPALVWSGPAGQEPNYRLSPRQCTAQVCVSAWVLFFEIEAMYPPGGSQEHGWVRLSACLHVLTVFYWNLRLFWQ